MAVGVQKVRQQAMCTATDLTADALDAYAVVLTLRTRPPLVRAPAGQGIGGATRGMRTSFGESKASPWKGDGGDVSFDGAREVLYNDHALGTPPPRGRAWQLRATVGGVVLSAQVGQLSTPPALPSSLATLAVSFLRRSDYAISVTACTLRST